jgi:hypothetical protein
MILAFSASVRFCAEYWHELPTCNAGCISCSAQSRLAA